MVTVVSGPFNHEFWKIDVPTAAQVYPSLWHATVALTAMYKSIKMDKKPIRPPVGSKALPSRNQLYIVALTHFNKSIQCLARDISSYTGPLTDMKYRDKEMILMTNIMYIGLCGMLGDDRKISSQCLAFTNMLEAMRFGEEDPASRQGIMAYDDLISIALIFDATITTHMNKPGRWKRGWCIQCPKFESFTKMTHAHLALLPTQFMVLNAYKDIMGDGGFAALKNTFRLDMLESYVDKLDSFEASGRIVAQHDLDTLKTIRLFIDTTFIREEFALATTRDAAMAADRKLFGILDRLDEAMRQTSLLDMPYSTEPPPFIFAPSFGRLVQIVLSVSSNPSVRRKAIELLKKWPHNEAGSHSDENALLAELSLHHSVTGPERTLPWQRAGMPIQSSFEPGDEPGEPFDGHNSCHCIPEIYICRDHKLGDFKKQVIGSSPTIGMVSWYELRNKLPYTWYSYEY